MTNQNVYTICAWMVNWKWGKVNKLCNGHCKHEHMMIKTS